MSITPQLEAVLRRNNKPVGQSIEIDEVYRLSAEHNERYPGDLVDVGELLKDSHLVYRSRPPGPPAATGMTEMEAIRRKAEERKYQRSIASVGKMQSVTAVSDVKAASESITFATHFIFAFASAFLVGYYLGEYVLELQKEEHKYILGGACSFLTLILESVLFIIREEKAVMIESKKRVVKDGVIVPGSNPVALPTPALNTTISAGPPKKMEKDEVSELRSTRAAHEIRYALNEDEVQSIRKRVR